MVRFTGGYYFAVSVSVNRKEISLQISLKLSSEMTTWVFKHKGERSVASFIIDVLKAEMQKEQMNSMRNKDDNTGTRNTHIKD